MKRYTKQMLLDALPSLYWQYGPKHPKEKRLAIEEQLRLTPAASPDELAAIVGQDWVNYWSRLNCDLCNQDVDQVVQYDTLRSEYGEYAPQQFCLNCLKKSIALLEE